MECYKKDKLSYKSSTPMGLLETIHQNYLHLKESKKMKAQRGQMTEFEFFNSPVNQVTQNAPKVDPKYSKYQKKVEFRKEGVTLAELRKHNKRHDAWISINYRVYDITDVGQLTQLIRSTSIFTRARTPF